MMGSQINRGVLIGAILLQIVGSSWCDVTIALNFTTFKNSASRDYVGAYCDTIFRSQCDHIFKICIDRLDGDQTSAMKFSSCEYGQWLTTEFRDTDLIWFDHDMHGVQNPIHVTIPNTEGGLLLKVLVTDDDRSKGRRNDHVDDLIYRYNIGDSLVKNELSVAKHHKQKQVIVGSRSESRTSLTVQFWAYCAIYYYMVDGVCSKYCKPRDDNRGHYICTDEGNIKCRKGWVDEQTNCTTSSVNCINRACKNRGMCIGGRTSFACNCTSGFKGDDCSEDIDECSQGTGKHGVCREASTARCDNTYGSYKCVCKRGYIKDFCQHSTPDVGPNDVGPHSKGVSGTADDHHDGNGLLIGLIVGMFLLLLIIVIVVACLVVERRKRHMKEQGTGTMLSTATMGQQTVTSTTDAGTGTINNAYVTDNGNANLHNYDNMRNQRAAHAQTGNGFHSPGRPTGNNLKALEAGLMAISPPYKERDVSAEDGVSSTFDNPIYVNRIERGAVGGDTKNNIYEEPLSVKLQKKY